jgi:hypothetical protein
LSLAAVAGIHELDRSLFRGVRRVKFIHGHALGSQSMIPKSGFRFSDKIMLKR